MRIGARHLLPTLASLLAFNCCGQVNNLNDNGPGSLRDVVGATLSGTVTFQPGLQGTITLTNGEIPIGQSITIQGPGADKLTVDGNANDRVFYIGNGATVTISGLCISNGLATNDGGGILNDPGCTLTLSNCWVVGNVTLGSGGGIHSDGTLALIGTTVSGNTARGDGGGIAFYGTGMTLSNCTITANTATDGGGIECYVDDTLNHCTVSGNTAQGGYGGGLDNGDSTAGTTIMINTIIAANTANIGSGPDVNGSVSSQGFNLIGTTDGFGWWITSGVGKDLTGADGFEIKPALGPLQFNVGQTPTMVPLPYSAAVDNGTAAGLSTDQRGQPRPQNTYSHSLPPGGDGSDIGAVEARPPYLNIVNEGQFHPAGNPPR
jgi:parallel beta-helix repeat protein